MMEKQLHLLTGSYALNALTDGERSDFERHALTDPQTLDEVRSLSETAALLAYGTPPETPPAALKADVMAAIRNTRQLPASSVVTDISSARRSEGRSRSTATPGRRWVPVLSAAAALTIFAGVGGWVAGHNTTQQDLQEKFTALQAEQQASQAQQDAMLTIMSSGDAKIATTELSDNVTVTVASSGSANKAAVMVDGMPPLPEDKTYELWFISPAGAVPAGLMTSTQAPAMQVLDGELAGATHVGITVEPAGGSESPTTTPLLVQEI